MNGDGSFPLDPDLLYDRLNKVTYHHDGAIDAFWHYLIEFVPEEMLQMRIEQKVYLSRYARIPPDYWEHREVLEMRQYLEATGNLVKRENGPERG